MSLLCFDFAHSNVCVFGKDLCEWEEGTSDSVMIYSFMFSFIEWSEFLSYASWVFKEKHESDTAPASVAHCLGSATTFMWSSSCIY